MLLRTKIRTMFGKAIILPKIGEVEISEQGTIEVEDSIASLLLDGDNWEQIEQSENEDENEDAPDEDGDEDEEADNVELSSKIDSMSLEDMLLLAKEANLKGFNLFSKDASKMRIFLKKKLQ
jgi:hypothetical protein